jgi:hypothetical protein
LGLIASAVLCLLTIALFAWLISHQPTVLFSQNKPTTSNQPEPASSTLLSEQTSTSHQPPANRTGCMILSLLFEWQYNGEGGISLEAYISIESPWKQKG